jgi:c-di-GMP-binding flagellar brake protein YcgR
MGINVLTPTGIKSIQRGTVSMSSTTVSATISSVNTSRTELRHLGYNSSNPGCSIVLTNATTITCAAQATGGTVSWELTEFY